MADLKSRQVKAKPRRHWAANRHPDFRHSRRAFWRCPHPDRLWVFLRFWFTESGPIAEDPALEFDIRDLVGWSLYPPIAGQSGPDGLRQHMAAELTRHSVVIGQAIEAGIDLVETTCIATLAEQEARAAVSTGCEDADQA